MICLKKIQIRIENKNKINLVFVVENSKYADITLFLKFNFHNKCLK